MRVCCPHCREKIEFVEDDPLIEVSCPSCGSSFGLAGGESPATDSPQLHSVGGFDLIEEIGRGAFGSVWKAHDCELERFVAVKLARRGQMDLASDDTERFLREARAAAQLRHSNIVSVHEVGRENGQVYIVSDLIQGPALDEWMIGNPPGHREAAKLAARISDALQHAHEQGIVHRDLKPANILIDQTGEPHLSDFGLAKRDASEITMTIEGRILGTPAYMPPEQARREGHGVDARADIYSLGVTLYQLLTCELPFRGETRMLIEQILRDEPPSLRRLRPSVPRDLETITLKCLQKEPARRYQSAKDLADDLHCWLAGHPIQARPIGPLERSWRWCVRNPAVAALSATAVVLLLAVAIVSTIGYLSTSEALTLAEDRGRELNSSLEEIEQTAYARSVQLAYEEVQRGNFLQARELIMSCPKALRAWEWHFVNRLVRRPQVRFKGWAYGFLPDGHHVVGTRYENIEDISLCVWDTRDGEVEKSTSLPVYGQPVVSPDGKWIAINHGTDKIDLYWTENLQVAHVFNARPVIAFSRNSELLAAAGNDRVIRIWRLTDPRQPIHEIPTQHSDHILTLSFDKEATRLACGSLDHTFSVWSVYSYELLHWSDVQETQIGDIAFSLDGASLATADSRLQLWNTETWQRTAMIPGQQDSRFLHIEFNESQNELLAVRQYEISLYDPRNLRRLGVFRSQMEPQTAMFSPEGNCIAVTERTEAVSIIDRSYLHDEQRIGVELNKIRGEVVAANLFSMAAHPRTDTAAIGFSSGQVHLLDTTNWERIDEFNVGSTLHEFSYSPDGRQFFSTRTRGPLEIRDSETHEVTSSFEVPQTVLGQLNCFAVSADGEYLVHLGPDGNSVQIRRLADGEIVRSFLAHPDRPVHRVVIDSQSRYLATAEVGQEIKVWRFPTEELVYRWENLGGTRDHGTWLWMDFSPDGNYLALANYADGLGGTIEIRSLETGQIVRKLRGHRSGRVYLRYFPSGDRLLSWDLRDTIRVWDPEHGRQVLRLSRPAETTRDCVFLPDGQRFISIEMGGFLGIFDGRPPGEALSTLQAPQ